MPLTEAQIQTRRKYIGGSDARTVLQGDAEAWQALYDEKINDVRREIRPQLQLMMDVGTAVEPIILRELHRKMPLVFDPPHQVWTDDPILAFSPDALTAERREPVQAKFHSGDQSILELAETYKAQLTHEMICSNSSKIWLAVIFGHWCKFQHLEVRRDEALVEQYLMKAMEFKDYLRTGTLPQSMVGEIAELNIERKRDHVWAAMDNEVSGLCAAIIENLAPHVLFEDSMDKMKKIIKRKEYADCASLTWRNTEEFGITFKIASNGAVRHALVFPKRPTKREREKAARKFA